MKQARGVLVFPSFVSAGFIVGGASGQGVLREGGKTVSYHRMTEGSVGLLAGGADPQASAAAAAPRRGRGWPRREP